MQNTDPSQARVMTRRRGVVALHIFPGDSFPVFHQVPSVSPGADPPVGKSSKGPIWFSETRPPVEHLQRLSGTVALNPPPCRDDDKDVNDADVDDDVDEVCGPQRERWMFCRLR